MQVRLLTARVSVQAAGATIDVDPSEAERLIARGQAVALSPQAAVAAPRETAEAPRPRRRTGPRPTTPETPSENLSMFMLSEDIKLTLVQASLADGQTDPDSARVDMAGFDGVLFVGIVGTITGSGTVTLTAKQADTDAVGTALEGGEAVAESSTDSDKLLVIDIDKPAKRYVGTTLTRATANSIYGGTLAIQYRARSKPAATAAAQLAAAIVQLRTPEEV